jgi:DNA-binding MarR family transcriptional regulator
MAVEMPERTELATDAWTAMLRFFFTKARPRMLELWREFDLQPPQQMVLELLDEPRPMGELALEMHCDSSNITGIVDRLEERGLVERTALARDRRVKLVGVTEEGRKLRDEVARRRSVPPPELAGLTDTELRALKRIFLKANPADR